MSGRTPPGPAPRPFRFALQRWNLPPDRWRGRVLADEAMGSSCVQFTDQLMPQWEGPRPRPSRR